jgi:prolyl-tRNA editing enzyme YbaK/EbsC (Cys-tRNA(Pro) deacylase)
METNMESFKPEHVQAALDSYNLGIRIRFFDNSTATSQLAADNIGCELGQIAKSLAFIVDGKPIVVIASGDQRVDDKKLAAMHDVGRKKVRPATPEQCVEIYGYAPGGVPPLAYRTAGLPVHLDDSLQRYEQIYAAGGAHNAIFPVTLEQLVTISGGQFADVKKEVGETPES